MFKGDCFAATKSGNCSALKEAYCETEECKFYKSKAQYEKEFKEIQKKLIEKGYYDKRGRRNA